MKKKIALIFICLVMLYVLVSCGESPVTTMLNAEQTEPEYYYQTVDNFFEIESDMRGSSEYFRHDETVLRTVSAPVIEATATIPSSVTVGDFTFQLTAEPIERSGRDLRYGITNGTPFSEDVPSYVVYDAVNGKMNGVFHMAFQSLTSEEANMEWEALAKLLIATYLPHVDLTDYVVIQNSDPDSSKGYDFPHLYKMQAQIDGYLTDRFIQVFVDKNKIVDVVSLNTYNYEELDRTLLEKTDQEEHQKILESYIDYVRNGNSILEPKYQETYVAWLEDGSYALQYTVVIKLKDTPAYSDWITAYIPLEKVAE